ADLVAEAFERLRGDDVSLWSITTFGGKLWQNKGIEVAELLGWTLPDLEVELKGIRKHLECPRVDPKWLEELQRRRSLDSASSKQEVGRASSGVEEMQESKFEAQPW
ncbi:hypothetical protein FOZ62_012225, partial [Perkinsus olseni]